jgi:Bromodomain
VEEKILARATEKLNVAELVVESGQFNKDSVDTDKSMERKRLMEILLTDFTQSSQPKGESSGDQAENDDDAGSDSSDKDDLNELLSNNESDYKLYSALEKEQERIGAGPVPMFTSDEDIPDWIRYPPTGPGSGDGMFTSVADGSSRKRKDVTYDDGLTECQFMRIMDKKSLEEEQAKKRAKTTNTSGRGRGRGRGRKSMVSPVVAGRPSISEQSTGASELTDWTFRKLISCGKAIVTLKDPNTKRRVADIFLERPDPATFPDYYEVIEKPVAINDILRRCRSKIYNNISEFKDDWKLMFSNARKFNGDDSWVVEDAKAIEKELERVMKKNGFVDDLKPPTSKATLTKSSTGKLKIKFSLKNLKKVTQEPEPTVDDSDDDDDDDDDV